jgi:HSP20 family molecular chaperone IbpA
MNITLVPKKIVNIPNYTVGSINSSYDPFQILDTWSSKWSGIWDDFDAVTSPSFNSKLDETNQDKFKLEIELPRFKSENINVSIDNGVLHVSAEQDSLKFYSSESFPDFLDAKTIAAKLDHGVLYVSASKLEAAKPRKIKVQVG